LQHDDTLQHTATLEMEHEKQNLVTEEQFRGTGVEERKMQRFRVRAFSVRAARPREEERRTGAARQKLVF